MNTISNTVSVETILLGQHDIYELKGVCRLCGVCRHACLDIFDEKHHYRYEKVINSHFKDNFQISKDDVLPAKLCGICRAKLTAWHEFYHNCLVVNKKFQQLAEKLNLAKTSEEKQPDVKPSTTGNDIEVIEVTVDNIAENCLFNESENSKTYDISNVNINETNLLIDAPSENDFDPLDDFSGVSDNDEEVADKDSAAEFAELPANESQKGKKNAQKSKNKKKSTVCRICGKLYTNRSTYLKHLQKWHSAHRGPKPPRKKPAAEKPSASGAAKRAPADADKDSTSDMCYKCGKCFKHRSSYRNHLKYVHAADPESIAKPKRAKRMCDLCGKLCSGNGFKSHMLRHTNPSVLTCKECNRLFAFPSTLKNHILVCHSKDRPHQCSMCPSNFKRADYLRSHIRYKHSDTLDGNGILQCNLCDNIYKTRKYYSLHLKTHSADDKPVTRLRKDASSYHCKVCNLDFKKRNYLMLHERYVHVRGQPYSISEQAEGQYQCDKCDRRFSSVSGRNYHCRKAHNSVFDMNFSAKCDHCGLTFKNRVFYARHQAKIAGVPTCYLCGEAFGSGDQLKQHFDDYHSSDLPFVCEVCHTRFVALKNLNHHLRTRHYNDKPYQCDLCDHRTSRKDALSIHIRACHLGEKPFQCPTCERRFSQKTDLRKHEVRHTREK